MALTLEEIGRLTGVSRSTVSRVINNSPGVRDETRERIWEDPQDGLPTSRRCPQPGHASHSHGGVIIPEAVTTFFTDPFFAHLLCGITKTCNANRYQIMLSLSWLRPTWMILSFPGYCRMAFPLCWRGGILMNG